MTPARQSDPLLQVRDLHTHFYTRDGVVHAVNGISLHVDEGETVALVGESGSGKSVALLSMMRLVPRPPGRIVRGQIFFQDRDLLQLDEREMRQVRGREMALIFQDPMTALNPVLSIGRLLMEGMEEHLGLDESQARGRALELLDLVGIPGGPRRLAMYPHQLSGGMRQRAMIAIALSCKPLLLLADEPTTALDVTIQAQMIELFQRLQRELGMALLWVTHDLGVTAGLADRLIVMYAGQVVEEGPVEPLYANPRHPYTIGLLQSLPRLDRARQIELTPIRGAPPDLIDYPKGCPFMERCPYAISQCATMPPLEEVAFGHKVACWVRPHGADVLADRSGKQS